MNLRLHNYQYFYRDIVIIIIIIIISEEELALKERYKNLSKKDLKKELRTLKLNM